MLGNAIFQFIRASRDLDAGELGDERAQNRNTNIQHDLGEALIPRSIFVSLAVNLKHGPFKSLRLARTLCTRYVCRFFKVINPENRLKDFPDPTPIKADARLRYSIITCDRVKGLGGELGPCLVVFPELRQLTERERTASCQTY